MTCRLLSLSSEAMWPELLRLLENRDNPDQTVETDVRAMLDAVRKGGDSAVLEYVRRVDCPDMRPPLRVPAEDLEQAARDIPAESLDCIKQAADNIRVFHEAQKDRSWFLTRDDGTILGQKIEAHHGGHDAAGEGQKQADGAVRLAFEQGANEAAEPRSPGAGDERDQRDECERRQRFHSEQASLDPGISQSIPYCAPSPAPLRAQPPACKPTETIPLATAQRGMDYASSLSSLLSFLSKVSTGVPSTTKRAAKMQSAKSSEWFR